jgi:hypothetical protein
VGCHTVQTQIRVFTTITSLILLIITSSDRVAMNRGHYDPQPRAWHEQASTLLVPHAWPPALRVVATNSIGPESSSGGRALPPSPPSFAPPHSIVHTLRRLA